MDTMGSRHNAACMAAAHLYHDPRFPDDLRETVSHLTVGGGGIQISELGGLRAQV